MPEEQVERERNFLTEEAQNLGIRLSCCIERLRSIGRGLGRILQHWVLLHACLVLALTYL